MPRALITGGSGFIGRHLVALLRDRGFQVRILDRTPPPDSYPNVEYFAASVTNLAAVRRAMEKVDEVYHLAGIPHLWMPDPADFELVNVLGTATAVTAARDQGIPRFVHCSSASVLFAAAQRADVVDETTSPILQDMPGPYTRSKLRAEMVVADAARNGLNVVIVNPTLPIGPNDINRTPPAAMIGHFLARRIPFYLQAVFNLADVRDVATGIALAAQRGRPGERYILGGDNFQLSELLRLLDELTGRRRWHIRLPGGAALCVAQVCEWYAAHLSHRRPAATVEGVRLALRSAPFDDRKARRELGYRSRPVRATLADLIASSVADRALGAFTALLS